MLSGYWVADVALLTSWLPVVGGLLVWRRHALGGLWVMLVVVAVLNLASFLTAMRGISNLWLSYLYPPILIGCALWALSRWPTFRDYRPAFALGGGLAALAALLAVSQSWPAEVINFTVYPLEAAGMAALASVGMFGDTRRRRDRVFAVALFFYFAPVAIFQGWLGRATVEPEMFVILYTIIQASHVVAYGVFTYAFVCPRRQPEPSPELTPLTVSRMR